MTLRRPWCSPALSVPTDRWYTISMSRSFPVILVPQSEGGFFVECPGLPGCYSQGETAEEALQNVQEAILLVIEDLAGHPS